jgi:hypothetical protein
LAEGNVTLNITGQDHQEVLLRCEDQWVMTWGSYNYPLRPEGDAWTAPRSVKCSAGGACKGTIRLFMANDLGFEHQRANAAASSAPGFEPPDPMGSLFVWTLAPSPVDADTKAFVCGQLTDWPEMPPNPAEYH